MLENKKEILNLWKKNIWFPLCEVGRDRMIAIFWHLLWKSVGQIVNSLTYRHVKTHMKSRRWIISYATDVTSEACVSILLLARVIIRAPVSNARLLQCVWHIYECGLFLMVFTAPFWNPPGLFSLMWIGEKHVTVTVLSVSLYSLFCIYIKCKHYYKTLCHFKTPEHCLAHCWCIYSCFGRGYESTSQQFNIQYIYSIYINAGKLSNQRTTKIRLIGEWDTLRKPTHFLYLTKQQ